MNEFAKSITNEEMEVLPLLAHSTPIYVIDTPEALRVLCEQLEHEPILGFDTESKPAFQKGVNHGVSLIQISTELNSYLIRIKMSGFTDELVAILENTHILKIGLSLKDDMRELRRTRIFEPHGFVDLQVYVKEFGIEDLSLKKIAAIVLKQRISKRQRLSNWEKETLDEGQKTYAALDSLAPYLIYRKLSLLKKK